MKEHAFVCNAEPPGAVGNAVSVLPVYQYVAEDGHISQLSTTSQELLD